MIDPKGVPWANGCHRCTYGVRDEHYQPLTGAVEPILERLVCAEKVGPSYFCDCQAGTALRNHLAAVRARYANMHLHMGAPKDGRKPEDVIIIEHVDIGNVILAAARTAMSLPHYNFDNNYKDIP